MGDAGAGKATQEKPEARGYRTVAVAMDYDPPAQVAAFVERSAPPFITFRAKPDRDGSIARGFEGVRLTPTSLPPRQARPDRGQKILREPDFDKPHGLRSIQPSPNPPDREAQRAPRAP